MAALVAAFEVLDDAELAPGVVLGTAADVLATGGGQGDVEDRAEGGGRCEEGTKSGSGGACVCSRVLITSNGVTVRICESVSVVHSPVKPQ